MAAGRFLSPRCARGGEGRDQKLRAPGAGPFCAAGQKAAKCTVQMAALRTNCTGLTTELRSPILAIFIFIPKQILVQPKQSLSYLAIKMTASRLCQHHLLLEVAMLPTCLETTYRSSIPPSFLLVSYRSERT